MLVVCVVGYLDGVQRDDMRSNEEQLTGMGRVVVIVIEEIEDEGPVQRTKAIGDLLYGLTVALEEEVQDLGWQRCVVDGAVRFRADGGVHGAVV